jgi:polyisoprenoid-binding protein YceI
VKKQTDTTYAGDATVACRGITKTYPLTFEVLATTADSVRIKGELAFSRLDFSIGVDPAKDPTERVDTPLTIRWLLTVKNT